MSQDFEKDILVIDVEATCSNDKSITPESMEIIELGAVLVDGASLAVKSEFVTFIRPVRHPHLTDFCKRLTHISQTDVDAAPRFPDAMKLFKAWIYRESGFFVFGSWGDYDRAQIEQDTRFHGVPYPIGGAFINLKTEFSKHQGISKKQGLSEALALSGLDFIGTPHRGIDDARNTARLLPYILGRASIPKPRAGYGMAR